MLPMTTHRLLIRTMRPDDAVRVAAYRNDPDVARYQDWPLPYTEQLVIDRLAARADVSLEDQLTQGLNLVIEADGEGVGDVYVQVEDGLAEVGWTLALAAQGRGYATEAATAVLHLLFTQLGAHRVEASIHPDNIASARVCETIGMTFEVHTRQSFRGREGLEDDVRYSVLCADWEAWTNRARHLPQEVRLVELGPDNSPTYRRLATHRSQERLVAPMWASYEHALFPEIIDGAPVVPWMRGIEADGEPAGFVMLAEVTEHHPEPYLWRLLIDRRHQRRGIAGVALGLVFERLRAEGRSTITTSWVDGLGSPRPFYERLKFVPTGDLDDGEIAARLTL